MKSRSPSLTSPIVAIFGVALGILSTGCPGTTCPQCTIKKASFTISPADGTIVDVVMRSTGRFTGHCNGQEDPDGCELSDERSLGVLKQEKLQSFDMPWTSDRDDVLTAEIDVKRRTGSGTVVQMPRPVVTISQ